MILVILIKYNLISFNIETDSSLPYPLYSPDQEIIDTGIDVGSYSTPQLIDLNRDGLLDLVIGERSGIDNGIYNGINYFEFIYYDHDQTGNLKPCSINVLRANFNPFPTKLNKFAVATASIRGSFSPSAK